MLAPHVAEAQFPPPLFTGMQLTTSLPSAATTGFSVFSTDDKSTRPARLMSTTVAIHLCAALDAELRKGAKDSAPIKAAFPAFHALLAAHALKPAPLFSTHQASTDFIWHVECPDHQAAAVVDKLLSAPGVEGAYAKPSDELPGPT